MTKITVRAGHSSGLLLLALLLALGITALARPAGAQEAPGADLSILKFDLPSDRVAVGERLSYELAVANNGPGTAAGVRVTDALPANTRFIAFTPGNPGSCTSTRSTVTCDLGELAPNAEASIFFDVCPVSPGTATNRATVDGTTPDPTTANNTTTETTRVTPGSGGCAASPNPPPNPPNPPDNPQPNAAPDARNDSYNVAEDKTLNVRGPGVLRNDRDRNGDRLTARVVRKPRHGKLNLGANGSLTYRPDRNFSGRDTFVYRASDGEGGTSNATVTITVKARPDRACSGGAEAGNTQAGGNGCGGAQAGTGSGTNAGGVAARQRSPAP